MKLNHAIRWIALVSLLSACSPVQLKQSFPPVAAHADREALSGVWQSGDGFLHVNFASNGLGRFAIPEWKGDDFKVDRGEFTLSDSSVGRYFTARLMEPEKKADPAWSLGCYKLNDDALIFCWAKPEPFARLIAAGKLDGQVMTNDDRKVLIVSRPEEVLKLIGEHESEDLFDYRNPGVFHKVSR